jgi:hypothetical protein
MSVTLEELAKRLAALEEEVARLREQVEEPPVDETPAERGARLLAQARRDKPRLKQAVAKAFAEMEISGEPVPPKKLREMMAACGIKPEENLFSRGILEERER